MGLTKKVMAGNKVDLVDDRRVTTDEAVKFARANDIHVCVELSAKMGDGVEVGLKRISEEVLRRTDDDNVFPHLLCGVLTVANWD